MLSTMVHAVFGYSLMGAGLARLVEVCFVARECNPQADEDSLSPFMHLPPFLLIASGFIFMASLSSQLAAVTSSNTPPAIAAASPLAKESFTTKIFDNV